MWALAGLTLGLLLMLPGHVIGATGAGDVKLVAAIGTMLGPSGVVVAFVYTALAGGLLALIVARRRRVLRDTIERTAALVRTGGANAAEIDMARRTTALLMRRRSRSDRLRPRLGFEMTTLAASADCVTSCF